MIRKMDNLGRIVIPIEIRKQLEIDDKTNLKIEVEDNKIVISKDASDYSKMLYANEELARKVMYYEKLLEKNNISYLK